MKPIHSSDKKPPLISLLLLSVSIVFMWCTLPAVAKERSGSEDGVRIYREFATAFIRGELGKATTMAGGPALRVVRRKQHLVSKGEVIVPPVGLEIMIVADNLSESGEQLDLVGVLIARNAVSGSKDIETKIHRQNITLVKFAGGWRVVAFEDDLEKCCLPAEGVE